MVGRDGEPQGSPVCQLYRSSNPLCPATLFCGWSVSFGEQGDRTMTRRLYYNGHPLTITILDGVPWLRLDQIAPCLGKTKAELESIFARSYSVFDPRTCRQMDIHVAGQMETLRVFSAEGVLQLVDLIDTKDATAFRAWISTVASTILTWTLPPSDCGCWATTAADPYHHTVEERLSRGISAMTGLISLLEALSEERVPMGVVDAQGASGRFWT